MAVASKKIPAPDHVKVRTALLSVSDKTGLVDLAQDAVGAVGQAAARPGQADTAGQPFGQGDARRRLEAGENLDIEVHRELAHDGLSSAGGCRDQHGSTILERVASRSLKGIKIERLRGSERRRQRMSSECGCLGVPFCRSAVAARTHTTGSRASRAARRAR